MGCNPRFGDGPGRSVDGQIDLSRAGGVDFPVRDPRPSDIRKLSTRPDRQWSVVRVAFAKFPVPVQLDSDSRVRKQPVWPRTYSVGVGGAYLASALGSDA